MLKALKQRVSELRQDTNWREKAEDHLATSSVARQQQQKPAEDMYDRISQNLNKNEDAKSVASERSQSISRQSYIEYQSLFSSYVKSK